MREALAGTSYLINAWGFSLLGERCHCRSDLLLGWLRSNGGRHLRGRRSGRQEHMRSSKGLTHVHLLSATSCRGLVHLGEGETCNDHRRRDSLDGKNFHDSVNYRNGIFLTVEMSCVI